MSGDAFAALRRTQGTDYAKLAEQHIQHDLNAQDRDKLKSAANTFRTHTLVGSFIGLALGGYLAIRLRQNRLNMYRAIRASEKPTHVRFADGREEAIPDVTPLLKPSLLGDVATYTFFAGGGILFGGEIGLLTGSLSARRSITSDLESRRRIEDAFRKFRIDVLKRETQALEDGLKSPFDEALLSE